MAIKLKVTQVKSGIGRPETQRKTLEGLGLRLGLFQLLLSVDVGARANPVVTPSVVLDEHAADQHPTPLAIGPPEAGFGLE